MAMAMQLFCNTKDCLALVSSLVPKYNTPNFTYTKIFYQQIQTLKNEIEKLKHPPQGTKEKKRSTNNPPQMAEETVRHF